MPRDGLCYAKLIRFNAL